MLTHALTPAGGVPARLQAITEQLRTIYAQAFAAAHSEATRCAERFEVPHGSEPFDPAFAADSAGCRAVNAQLSAIVREHFPGADVLDELCEPTVIDSVWHHSATGLTFIVEWDHTRQFGDPAGLAVREVQL